MEGATPNEPRVSYEIQVPADEEAGRYANFLSVWHSQHEFTLDFSALQPPTSVSGDSMPEEVTIPTKVVARLRVPPTLLFDILQALNANLTRYEETFGEIRRFDEEQE